jgi:hypothetical protein
MALKMVRIHSMSILLDALKKSEAQRQLGDTPTIHSSVEGEATVGKSTRMWIPLVLIVLSVSIMAWFGSRQYRVPDGTVSIAEQTSEDSTASDAVAAETPGQQQPDTDLSGSTRTPVESFQDRKELPKRAGKTGSGVVQPVTTGPATARPDSATRNRA